MVSQLKLRLIGLSAPIQLLIIAVVICVVTSCGRDTRNIEDAADSFHYAVDWSNLPEDNRWPIELPEESLTVTRNPSVYPEIEENDSIQLSWWGLSESKQTHLHVIVYEFDDASTAADKIKVLEAERFNRNGYIRIPFLSRPYDVFIPQEIDDFTASIAAPYVAGCVEFSQQSPAFIRCDYIAQYSNLLLNVSVVSDGSEIQPESLDQFEELIIDSQKVVESQPYWNDGEDFITGQNNIGKKAGRSGAKR